MLLQSLQHDAWRTSISPTDPSSKRIIPSGLAAINSWRWLMQTPQGWPPETLLLRKIWLQCLHGQSPTWLHVRYSRQVAVWVVMEDSPSVCISAKIAAGNFPLPCIHPKMDAWQWKIHPKSRLLEVRGSFSQFMLITPGSLFSAKSSAPLLLPKEAKTGPFHQVHDARHTKLLLTIDPSDPNYCGGWV